MKSIELEAMPVADLISDLQSIVDTLCTADSALSNQKLGTVARSLDESKTKIAKLIERLEFGEDSELAPMPVLPELIDQLSKCRTLG